MTYYEKKLKGTSIYEKNGSYYLKKMINREWLRMKLGRVGSFDKKPTLDRQKANALANENILKAQEHGVNSVKGVGRITRGKVEGQAKTVKDVLEHYIAIGSKRGTTKTKGKPLASETIRGFRFLEKGAWKPLIDLPMASISPEMLEQWYIGLHDEGLENNWLSRHNEALRKLARVFNWALNENWIEINYAERLYKSHKRIASRPKKEDKDKRFELKTNEIGKFVYSLLHTQPKINKKTDETARDLIMTYILCGGRQSEIKKMQWSWFDSLDIETGFESWISPSDFTKTNKDYYYPCSRLLKELFVKRYKNREKLAEQQPEGNSALKYVFPDFEGTKHIEDPRARIENVGRQARFKKKIGYHFFRFTFQSICEACTDSDALVIRAMHHVDKNISFRVYGSKQHDDDKLRGLFQDVEDYISQRLPLSVTALSGQTISFSGTEGLARDNRTPINEIKADVNALADIYFGRRSSTLIALNLPEIQHMNLDFIKKKFPNAPDDFFIEKTSLKEDIAIPLNLIKETMDLTKQVQIMMGYNAEEKIAITKIRKYVNESKLPELKAMRKKFNILINNAKKEFAKVLLKVEINEYLTKCQVKQVDEFFSKQFINLFKPIVESGLNKNLNFEEGLKEFKAIKDEFKKLKFISNFIAIAIKEMGVNKIRNKMEFNKKKIDYFLSKNDLSKKTKEQLKKFIDILTMPNPILDQYYIDLKKKHKNTKDNRKVIWLNRVKTSIDASNEMPTTLEVK